MQQKIRFPTSYHNKAVIAEGVKPILPLRWEFLFLCTSHFLQQVHPYMISNLFRLQIAPINFFIGVCIPSLSDAFGCNLFEHIEDDLFIIILLHI